MSLGFTYAELGSPNGPGSVTLPDMPSYVEAEIPVDTFEDWRRVKFAGCLFFEEMGGDSNDANEYYMAMSFGPC